MPFVVYGLPRSRTAWLAHWLGRPHPVGHDLAIHADTAQQFLDSIWHDRAGTCETAAVKAHKLLRIAMPNAKFMTIRRPVAEVAASLTRFGITGQDEELALRDRLLDEAEADGAVRVDYHTLGDVNVCAGIWEYLLETPFDFALWRLYHPTRIQVDMPARLARLDARREQIARLEAEVADLLARPEDAKFYRVGRESWATIWADAKPMGEDNYLEVNNGARLGHPFAPDDALISEAERQGVFFGFSARCNGRLVGYASWSIHRNPESAGMILADQGALYAQPGHPRIGRKLFDVGLAHMRKTGAHEAQLHAPFAGRGVGLGRLYQRLGARPVQTRYALPLGIE